MAKSQYDAYAGVVKAPNGKRVSVFYLDRNGIVAAFGDRPRGHPERKPIGWYWRVLPNATRIGPFTSSRKAFNDAMAKNGGDHG